MFVSEALTYVQQRFNMSSVGTFLFELRGQVDGVAIRFDASADRSKRLRFTAFRPRGSDIGLSVDPAGMFAGAARFATGDSEFDGIFSRSCAPGDEAAAEAIVDSAVRAELRSISRLADAALSDHWVTATSAQSTLSGPELEQLARAAVAAALAADRATDALSAPAALARLGVDRALEDAARAHSLALRRHPLAAGGTTERGDALALYFAANRSPASLLDPLAFTFDAGCIARVSWVEPLGGPLTVRPASLIDRAQAALGYGDIEVGDAEFDKAFTITARVEGGADAARSVVVSQLNARARSLLLRARLLGIECSLDERQLFARGPLPKSAADVHELVRVLVGLGPALRDRTSTSPYR